MGLALFGGLRLRMNFNWPGEFNECKLENLSMWKRAVKLAWMALFYNRLELLAHLYNYYKENQFLTTLKSVCKMVQINILIDALDSLTDWCIKILRNFQSPSAGLINFHTDRVRCVTNRKKSEDPKFFYPSIKQEYRKILFSITGKRLIGLRRGFL